MAMMLFGLAVGVWLGAGQAKVFPLPAALLSLRGLDKGFIEGLEAYHFFSAGSIGTVWFHNLRTILLATVIGIFSFGVLGMIVLALPMAIIGYIMANMVTVGLSPVTFFSALVLPHGVLEIPAIILTGAAILQLGATLAAPAPGMTIGEAWLRSLADWARVVIGLAVPLFLGAAVLEVLVTPRVAVMILGGG
jgi:uncharacterized membrane protein SpoIIM required for sporulation